MGLSIIFSRTLVKTPKNGFILDFFYTLLYTRVYVCNCVHFTLFSPVDNFVHNFFCIFFVFYLEVSKKGVHLHIETLKHIKMKTQNENNINYELLDSWKYVANGIINSLFQCGNYPTVKDVKNHWQYIYNHINLNDCTIEKMITNISKYYN